MTDGPRRSYGLPSFLVAMLLLITAGAASILLGGEQARRSMRVSYILVGDKFHSPLFGFPAEWAPYVLILV